MLTVGLVESNGNLLPGLWLTSPAGWLPWTGISSGTLRSVVEHGLPLPFLPCYLVLQASTFKPSVLRRCWLGGRKGIRPVKNWVVECCRGYLSGARCRLAYGPADAAATHCLASVKSRLVLPFWYRLTRVVPDKEPLNGCVVCVSNILLTLTYYAFASWTTFYNIFKVFLAVCRIMLLFVLVFTVIFVRNSQYNITYNVLYTVIMLSLIHIWRCRRLLTCRSRWSPYH